MTETTESTDAAAAPHTGAVLSRFALMLIAGVVGGALAWCLIAQFGDHFQVSADAEVANNEASSSASPSMDPTFIAERNLSWWQLLTG